MSMQHDTKLVRVRNGERKYYGIYLCGVCGREKEIYDYSVRYGASKSCGCDRARKTGERSKGNNYGHRHGRHKTRTYRIWTGMLQRCNNSNSTGYENYGGRGIKVCERWQGKKGFLNFLSDMGESPSGLQIERKNNDGDYEPSNCKWATRTEELRNTRRNRKYTFNGKTQCLMDWSVELGIHYNTLKNRLDRGWSVERAFTSDVQQHRSKS